MKSLFAQSMEQHILPNDLGVLVPLMIIMKMKKARLGKRKRPKDQSKSSAGGSSPTENVPDNKIRSALPAPVFTQNGTKPKSGSK